MHFDCFKLVSSGTSLLVLYDCIGYLSCKDSFPLSVLCLSFLYLLFTSENAAMYLHHEDRLEKKILGVNSPELAHL
jgi:hypothetical protein